MTAITKMYRAAMAVSRPVVNGWGRMEVRGVDQIPADGPLLIVGNHDSYFDTVSVGIAAMPHRQIRALAKQTLWKVPGLATVLNGMGQIPIRRGSSDAVALARAIEELEGGACIGVFPEGTRSLGRTLRARSGVGRLALAVPGTEVVLVAATGTTDFARFPERPSVKVEFFRPRGGGLQTGEDTGQFAARLLAEIREKAPPKPPGRKPVAAEA